jgi:CBS domain-containing protein
LHVRQAQFQLEKEYVMADERGGRGRNRENLRENDEELTRRTDPADTVHMRPDEANRGATDERRMVAPDPKIDAGFPGQRPRDVPKADTGEERPEATYVLTGDLTGSRDGAALKGRDATPGELETPRQSQRQFGPAGAGGGGAPETADPNYTVTHSDVGNDAKAGKTAASLDDLNAPRGARVRGAMPMTVRDVMTPIVEVCTPQTELYYVARMMADRDVGAIPVVDNTDSMKPIGIITDRDIVVRALAKRQDVNAMKAGDCMSSGVVTVTPDGDLQDCIATMEREQVRRIVVTDAFGRCVGIVAQADIATKTMMSTTADLVREVSKPDGAQEQRRYH